MSKILSPQYFVLESIELNIISVMGRYKIIILITIIFFIAKRNWNKSTCGKFFQKFVSREKFGFLQKSSSSSGVSSV